MLEIGSLIDGKYKILSVIGHGGMSTVYMAINEKANKTWAVKEVRKSGVIDFEAVKLSLVAETDMLKRFHHPNLPSIIDVIDDQDVFLIVMDYVEGNSLGKALKEYGALPEEYVIDWARQLSDVLGYLHSRKPPIIYRDMKPDNIMLKPDGNLSLIDFGTAREFDERKTGDTTCLGTIGYAAPEQFGNMGQTDARTDIYGLGATLYHLVTGKNPSEPPYEMLPIREVNGTLSKGLEKIILKCTEKNPDDRYQSAAEVMYALNHIGEIDESYRRKQKRKLVIFGAAAVLSMVFFATGLISMNRALQQGDYRYQNLMESAEQTSDYGEKERAYVEAIQIPDKGGDKSAYLKLIEAYKNNDHVLSLAEAQSLETLIRNHRAQLLKDPEGYAEICYEAGKLYWYYYDWGDQSSNFVTRAKSAIGWFDAVLEYAPENDPKRGMAEVYSGIGRFYRDIATDVTEGSDRGKYRPLFRNMRGLVQRVARDPAESEMVRLQLLAFTQMSLQQYATKFKGDHVTREEIRDLLNQVRTLTSGISASTEVTEALKQTIVRQLSDTETAVSTAYDTEAVMKTAYGTEQAE